MKQLIVMIATILLGIVIAGVVLGFSDTARNLTNGVGESINSVFNGHVNPAP